MSRFSKIIFICFIFASFLYCDAGLADLVLGKRRHSIRDGLLSGFIGNRHDDYDYRDYPDDDPYDDRYDRHRDLRDYDVPHGPIYDEKPPSDHINPQADYPIKGYDNDNNSSLNKNQTSVIATPEHVNQFDVIGKYRSTEGEKHGDDKKKHKLKDKPNVKNNKPNDVSNKPSKKVLKPITKRRFFFQVKPVTPFNGTKSEMETVYFID